MLRVLGLGLWLACVGTIKLCIEKIQVNFTVLYNLFMYINFIICIKVIECIN